MRRRHTLVQALADMSGRGRDLQTRAPTAQQLAVLARLEMKQPCG